MFFGFLAFVRMPVWGGDKALPLCNPKVRVGLMPDSHNAICESCWRLRIPLDGDWPEPDGSRRRGPTAFDKIPYKFLGQPEPNRHMDGLNPKRRRVRAAILSVDQIRIR